MSTSEPEPLEFEPIEDEAPRATGELAAAARAELQKRGRSGADWFFWIAGLSLVNTAIMHFGGNIQFVVGLGVTLIVDAVAREAGAGADDSKKLILTVVAVGFSVFCSAIAALVGWLSRKGFLVIYGVGMFVYVLDGALFLLLQDWFSIAFHGLALWSMWSGFTAFRQLNALDERLATAEAA
jgi:hypothetical protein